MAENLSCGRSPTRRLSSAQLSYEGDLTTSAFLRAITFEGDDRRSRPSIAQASSDHSPRRQCSIAAVQLRLPGILHLATQKFHFPVWHSLSRSKRTSIDCNWNQGPGGTCKGAWSASGGRRGGRLGGHRNGRRWVGVNHTCLFISIAVTVRGQVRLGKQSTYDTSTGEGGGGVLTSYEKFE